MKKKKSIYDTNSGIQGNLSAHIRSDNLRKIAAQRGVRLRTLRSMTRMNLEDFANSIAINSGTLGRLERGDSCLPIKTSDWIAVQVLNQHKILVTTDWLLLGQGEGPKTIDTNTFNLEKYISDIFMNKLNEEQANKLNSASDDYKRDVLTTYCMTDLFYNMHINSLICYVKDNKMSPVFNKGEIVGGIALSTDNIQEADGQDCIIGFNKGPQIIRTVNVVNNNQLVLTTYDRLEKPEVVDMPKIVAPINFRYKSNYKKKIAVQLEGDFPLFDVVDFGINEDHS